MAELRYVDWDGLVYYDGKIKEFIADQNESYLKAGGDVTFAALPSPSYQNLNYVYKITEEFTSNDLFDKPGYVYAPNTLVMVADNNGVYLYTVVIEGTKDISGNVEDLEHTTLVVENDIQVLKNDTKVLRKDLDKVTADVTALGTNVDTLVKDVNDSFKSVANELADINSKLALQDAEDETNDCTAEIAAMQLQINSIERKVVTAESNATKALLGATAANTAALKAETNLTAKFESVDAKATENIKDIADLRARVNIVEANVTTVEHTVSTISTNVAGLAERLSLVENIDNDLATELADINLEVDTAQSTANIAKQTADEAISKNSIQEEAIANVDTRVRDNANSIDTLSAKITNVEATIDATGNDIEKIADRVSMVEVHSRATDEELDKVNSELIRLSSVDNTVENRLTSVERSLENASSAMHFLGVSTTDPSTGVVTIEGELISGNIGDVVLYNEVEYVYAGDAEGWVVRTNTSAYLTKTDAANTYATIEAVQATYATKNEVNTVNVALTQASTKIETNVTDINTLKSKVSNIESDLSTLTTNVDTKADKTALAELATKSEVQESINSLTESVNNNTSSINSITDRVGNVETKANTLEQTVVSLEERIEALEIDSPETDNNVSALEGRIDTLEIDVNTVKGNIQTLEDNIEDLQTQITTNKTNITSLTTDINEFKSDVTSDIEELTAALGEAQGDIESIGESLTGKQNTLISGTNIKTINGQSLLGSGDIAIETGSGTVSSADDIIITFAEATTKTVGGLTAGTTVNGWSLTKLLQTMLFGTGSEEIQPTQVTLNKTALALNVGDTATLSATVLPADAVDKTIIWTSSKSNVASIENGLVTALAEGETTIIATTINDLTAECVVTVTAVTLTVVEDIMQNERPMYSLNAEGTLSEIPYNLLTIAEADKDANLTENGFYQIVDAEGTALESGYQLLSAINMDMFYHIALPEAFHFNDGGRIDCYDALGEKWVPCYDVINNVHELTVTDDLSVIQSLYGDEYYNPLIAEEQSLPGYNVWVINPEETAGGKAYRFVLE